MFNNSTKYQIFTNSILQSEDYKYITKYYLPIIGPISSLLYLNFLSVLEKNDHSELINISRLQLLMATSIDNIYSSINILAKVGLLNIFKSQSENEYLFEVINPKNSGEFFTDVRLTKMLEKKLDQSYFDELKNSVSVVPFNLNNFTRLNEDFVSSVADTEVKSRTAKKNSYEIYFESLNLNNTIDEIIEITIISSSNRLSKIEIESILPICLKDNHIDLVKFKRAITILREDVVNPVVNPVVNSVVNPVVIPVVEETTNVSSISETVKVFDEYQSEMFLMKVNNGRKLSPTERSLITSLRNEYKLADPVINVLIDYVLRTNDMMLNKAFVEAIAANWSRKSLKTAVDAMNYVKEFNRRRNQNQNKKVEPKIAPNWLNSEDTYVESNSQETIDLFKSFEEA